MYMVRQASGTVAYDSFFILCVVFGSFFVLNLMIAVQFSSLDTSSGEAAPAKNDKNNDDGTGEQEDDAEDMEGSSNASEDSNANGS